MLKERIAKVHVRRRTKTFAGRPAVIRSSDSVVDFLPGALAHVVDEQPAGSRLKPEGERIPQASAQMARLAPVAVPKNGLSVGMVPSEL